MVSYVLSKSFGGGVACSEKVLAVAGMFGLGADHGREVKVLEDCEIRVEAGQVVYVTGASGSGKTLILKLLKEKMEGVLDLNEQEMVGGKALVDCFEEELGEALMWLSQAGLSDAFAILRRPEELSEGQRYRFGLALALARKPQVVMIDEFCAALDRVTAAVVAHNVRKFADRFGTTFVLATSHDDLLEDLEPDVVVVKQYGMGCEVFYPKRIESRY